MAKKPDAQALLKGLEGKLAKSNLKAIVKVEVRGEGATAFYARIDKKLEIAAKLGPEERPDVILGGELTDLDALLKGRTSFADALVAERVTIAGDVIKIAQLKTALGTK